jgi:ABC-type phosphate/phosphonate transport system substrate-binding protein
MNLNNDNEKFDFRIGHMIYKNLDASPNDIKLTLGLWIKELSNHIKIPIKTIFYENMDDLKTDIEQNKINYIILNPLDVVNYIEEDILMPGYAPSRKNFNANNKIVLVVRKKDNITNISELKNKKIGIFKNDQIGKLYLDTLVLKNSYTKSDKFFSKIKLKKNRSRALNDLFFKKIDAAIINQATLDLMMEMNPQVGKSIKIINSIVLQTSSVAFFIKGTPQNLMNKFHSSISTLHENKRAQQILTLFKADELKKINISQLKTLKELKLENIQLSKKTNVGKHD